MRILSSFWLILLIHSSFAQAGAEQPFTTLLKKADSCKDNRDYETALSLYESLLDKASIEVKLDIQLSAADIFYELADFDTSYQLYKTIHLKTKDTDQKSLNANALHGMAHILWRSGDNVQAISYIIQGIEIFQELKDEKSVIRSSNVLAGIYMSLDNLDQAEKIYSEMLEKAIQMNDSVNMAWTNEYLGVLYFYRGDNPKSMDFYKKALSINLRLGREMESGINYSNMGETYMGMGEYQKSIESLLKGKKILEKHGFRSALIFVYYTLGQAYTAIGQYQKALDYYNLSLETMIKTGETREVQYAYDLIATNYAKQGKYKEAFEFHQLHSSAKDSIFNAAKVKQLQEIKAKYDIEKKEQENYFLAREIEGKQFIIFIQYIAGILLLLFLAIAIFLSYKLYRNRQLLLLANQTKDKMFGFLAHDLRSPASIIKSLSDLISQDSEFEVSEEERESLIKELRSSALGLMVLLDDLLAWSITQQQGYNFKPERVQIKQLSEQVKSLFCFLLRNKGLQFESVIPDDLHAHVDPKVLLTIMRNLLSNAIKFTPEKGFIYMEAQQSDDMILLKIKDTGVGMTPEQVNRILSTRQFKSSKGTAKEEGSGLGLNMVKDFVKESRGKMEIKSEVDKGTCFEVYLPKASA